MKVRPAGYRRTARALAFRQPVQVNDQLDVGHAAIFFHDHRGDRTPGGSGGCKGQNGYRQDPTFQVTST